MLIRTLLIVAALALASCEEPTLYKGNVTDLAYSTVYFKDWKGNCFAFVATPASLYTRGGMSITLVPAPNCEGDLRPPPRRERP
jgi:hypothetical protein